LENAPLREQHFAGWRCVLEKRAVDPHHVPAYVLQDESAQEALRRGWCMRLAREAAPLATVPERFRDDAMVRAGWLSGWERQLREVPLSVWEIPDALRGEERIREAWKDRWLVRFDAQLPGEDFVLLQRYLFSGKEIPLERRLWIAPVLANRKGTWGRGAENCQEDSWEGRGVPSGYEEAEAQVQVSCRNWARRFLGEYAWSGEQRPEWNDTPEVFAALCQGARSVPPWEQIAAEIRSLPAVREAWIARHPLDPRSVYSLQNRARGVRSAGDTQRALQVLFERPWAVIALPEPVQQLAEVRRAVREGWAEKLREKPVYRELREFCEGALGR
jgi:hypothetical protein